MTRRGAEMADRKTSPNQAEDAFVPKGAIAFFAVMIAFYVALWFGLYALLLQRG